MSSIKSTVRLLMPLELWQRFVNHEILLKRCFEVREFQDTFYEYDKSDFITMEDYFEILKKDVLELDRNYGYQFDELEDEAYKYSKKMTFEDFKKVAFAERDEKIVELEKPIVVDYGRYYHDDKDHHHTYTHLTANDIWNIIFHWSLTRQRPSVYFYDGDYEKDTKEIREYTRGDGVTKDVFVVRSEEC